MGHGFWSWLQHFRQVVSTLWRLMQRGEQHFLRWYFFHHITESQWLKISLNVSLKSKFQPKRPILEGFLVIVRCYKLRHFDGFSNTVPAQNAWDDQPFFHDEIHARNTVFLIFHNKLVTIKNHDVLMNRQINSPVLGWLWGTPLSSSKLNSLTWEEGWWVDH